MPTSGPPTGTLAGPRSAETHLEATLTGPSSLLASDTSDDQSFRMRNKRKEGPNPFTLDSVRSILHNRFFTGKVKYKDYLYAAPHEPLVSEELFDKVQKVCKAAMNRTH